MFDFDYLNDKYENNQLFNNNILTVVKILI
jgi:hypothetical protein